MAMDDSPLSNRPVYRAYVVGPGGGILLAHDLQCESDEEAIRNAQEYARGNAVELWDKGRKVAEIPIGDSPLLVR